MLGMPLDVGICARRKLAAPRKGFSVLGAGMVDEELVDLVLSWSGWAPEFFESLFLKDPMMLDIVIRVSWFVAAI